VLAAAEREGAARRALLAEVGRALVRVHGMTARRLAALAASLTLLFCAALTGSAEAAHFDRSANIALIPDDGGGSDGGAMPTDGTVVGTDQSFDQFSFTDVALDEIDSATLSQYDTVVLTQVQTVDLSDDAKQALSDFVIGGGKLIIHDADGTDGNDYGWLPAPAATGQSCQNCGETSGTSEVIENNTLVSADPSSPAYVNVSELEENTDAVGDANVMVTQDSHWFVDIRATNSLGDTGAVHTYASDNGLIIFNGYDTDDIGETQDSGVDWLAKLWYQELNQEWSPDALPHATPVDEPVDEPVLPPPARDCLQVTGGLLTQFVASIKCSAIQTYLEAQCGFAIASLTVPELKVFKAAKTARGTYRLSKLAKKYRPAAKLYNDLARIKLSRHGPKGYRTVGEIYAKFHRGKHAYDVIKVLIELHRHLSRHDYLLIARDVAELAGLRPCIQGLANAVA
jgi:hypothetical protein